MSPLRQALEDYLAVRRGLGFELRAAGAALDNFVSFAEQEGADVITTDLALRWAQMPADVQPCQWGNRLGMLRRFAQYRQAADPRTQIPPQELLPYQYRRRPPYIYSDEEIEQLLQAARQLPSNTGLRPAMYATLLGLLAVTGMRLGEVLSLEREDLDRKQGVLTLRRTKFGKSRYVPLHPSTQQALRGYEALRDRIHPKPRTPSFFLSEQGRRPSENAVRGTFLQISRRIGLRGPTDRDGPRLHDLRHRFAVRTLLSWYRAGVDVERNLPKLAAYLGHSHIHYTYWYLTAVPELLGWATSRLEADWEPGGES